MNQKYAPRNISIFCLAQQTLNSMSYFLVDCVPMPHSPNEFQQTPSGTFFRKMCHSAVPFDKIFYIDQHRASLKHKGKLEQEGNDLSNNQTYISTASSTDFAKSIYQC